MHRWSRSSLLVAALVGALTRPAWAGSSLNTWLSDSSHHRLLWTILYVMLGVLVLLVAWEAFFQLQRRRERLQVDLSHGAPPPLEGAGVGGAAAARAAVGAPAAADEDPFKSLLRRSAAAANAEGEERARASATAQARPATPAPRPSPPQEPTPVVDEGPPPVAAFLSPTEEAASVDASGGGRKMVRLNLGGEALGADEGLAPEVPAEPRRSAPGASPPRIAITPAPERAGKDSWSDLLKKAPASAPSPPSSAAPAEEGHAEAAGDPWKSLLKKTRDEGTSPAPGSSSGRLGASAPLGARPLPARGASEATRRSSEAPSVQAQSPVPPQPAPPQQATSRTSSPPGAVALPAGATRASWDHGLAQLHAAVVGRCSLTATAAVGSPATGEPAGASGVGAGSEPKRGRRMKLAGASGDAGAPDGGDQASPPVRDTEAAPRPLSAGGASRGVPLAPATRRLTTETKGEGEPLRLADRPATGASLRVVRSTRETHGDAEKEIPGLLRNAEESYRPGEIPEGVNKSRAAQGDSPESL